MNRGVTLLMLGLLSIVQLSTAAVIEVPDDYPLIQMALDSCSSGDTVLVAPGHYFERLEIPERNLTLASHWLLTGDSLHIRQTIIDADSLGRVIRTRTGNGGNRLIVDGLTIRGGVNTEQSRGTGIEINDNTDVALRNLYFEDNYSAWDGACIFIVGQTLDSPRAELKNIRGRNNRSIASVLKLISGGAENTIFVDGVYFDSLSCGLISFSSSVDTCIVRNIRTSHNTSSQTMISVGMRNATENSYQEYDNISITNSQWHGSQLINIGGSSAAIVRNICLEDNVRVGDRDGSGNMFNSSIGAGSIYDNLIMRRNRGAVVGATGGSLQLYRLPNDEPSHGYIRNLIMEGNVLGDSSYTPWNGLYSPAMLTVKNLCIDGAVIQNNTHILTPGPEDPEWGVSGASLIYVDEQSPDTLILKNMLFEHNLVIDRDDNDALSIHGANSGRCLWIEPVDDFDYFLMDSVVFDSNLQPNMFTEEPFGGWLNDGSDIGSLVYIRNNFWETEAQPKFFTNLIFRGNDDGGLQTFGEIDLRFSNIQMIDMHRQAFDLHAHHVELDNALIDGCSPYAPLPVYSEQMPLRLHVTDSGFVRNSTIINCTTPYVVMAGLHYPDSGPGPIVHFENCLFASNEYDRFEALVVNYTDTPGWDPYVSGSFSNCLLQEVPDVGANNLIGLDPLFDESWGAPYLAADSPCIDGGSPDSTFNDLEDPANPGFALWPSQGSTRNDMGVTGGPRAAVIDTQWVDVKPNQREARPQSFSLGDPYPNPFNPVTRISFSLDRTSRVEFRLFNLCGQEVGQDGSSVSNYYSAGRHELIVDGSALATGIYFAEIRAGEERAVARLVLLK